MKMSDKLYNVLKWVVMIVMPAMATLYQVLAGLWNFPFAEQIVGTITALATFLGACLMISTKNYNKAQEEDGSTD